MPTASAEPYPFEGAWDCGVGIFTLTATTYNPGEEELEIIEIAAKGPGHVLTMVDSYQVAVTVNPDGSLHWLSLVSGDDFTCAPLP